jgi:uncharacterized membrane protein YkoI
MIQNGHGQEQEVKMNAQNGKVIKVETDNQK